MALILKIIHNIIWPHIVLSHWTFSVTFRIHVGSKGCDSLTYNANICLLFHFLSVFGCLGLWADNSQKLSSFWARVYNLSLEWNFFQFININFHEFKIFIISNLILKGNFGINCCVWVLFFKDWSVLDDINFVLISKNHRFMEFNHNINIQANHFVT